MKIRYEYVTGEAMEIEVDGTLAEALCALGNEERKNERRETRRHVSLDESEARGAQYAGDAETQEEALRAMDMAVLQAALDRLTPAQRRLVWLVYFEGRSISEVARSDNVSHVAVIDRLRRINHALKKSFK